MRRIDKYPRTRHVGDSRLQSGDHDLTAAQFDELCDKHIVIEEKVDGANCGISFDDDFEMYLQSRGHYLTGGPRERQWDLFKSWANQHRDELLNILEDRYTMYGEWLYAKHTVFYDALPHYFLEFDIYDKQTKTFLSTRQRQKLLVKSSVKSVKVLYEGPVGRDQHVSSLSDLKMFVTHSYFKTGLWKKALLKQASNSHVDPADALAQTDQHDHMEGLYIKSESDLHVLDRYKWVRHTFLSAIAESDTHWADRPIIPNMLAPDAVQL